jgi:hypothetical protein
MAGKKIVSLFELRLVDFERDFFIITAEAETQGKQSNSQYQYIPTDQ